MTEATTLNLSGHTLTECCKKLIPGQTDELLLNKLQDLIPEFPVRLALTGDDWYRLGGVVDMHGNRLSNDITEWVERSYIECGQNLQTLIEHADELQLIATKQTGKTLYFVIQTGNLAEDFTVVEIEKTHEVSDRMLVDLANPPEDLEEFIDPLIPLQIESFCFGHSRYTYRRKTDIKLFMELINARHPTEHPVQRFIDDWNRSSAGQNYKLSDDWLIRPNHHTGRFGEQIHNVEIINTHQADLLDLEHVAGKKGTALGTIFTRFDRQVGYPFAWFFYMLKSKRVSPQSAEAAFRDLANDFAYLPERDEAILRDWIASPYNV